MEVNVNDLLEWFNNEHKGQNIFIEDVYYSNYNYYTDAYVIWSYIGKIPFMNDDGYWNLKPQSFKVLTHITCRESSKGVLSYNGCDESYQSSKFPELCQLPDELNNYDRM